jgi:hypothetical protein
MLVEGDTDPLLLPPDDTTGDVCFVRLKYEVETVGDVLGVGNFDRRPRDRYLADQAVDMAASELNPTRHQYLFTRIRPSFHESRMRRNS